MIGLAAQNLDSIVKPELAAEWETAKAKWFADSTPEQQKTPGFLKEEFSSEDGVYIGLSSKESFIN